MPEIRVISWQDHGHKRWLKPNSYAFTAQDQVVAIGLSEIPRLMMSLPIAFAKAESSYLPVALLGFRPAQNLLVGAQGQWLADYIPLLYRSYPFKLARNSENQYVLCVVEESGLVTEGPIGIRFFDENRKPTEETNAVANALMQFENDRSLFLNACRILAEHDVIEPWPFRVQEPDGVNTYEGLFRVNEVKLNSLPADALVALRNTGGLAICYGHLFSMQHVQQLANTQHRTAWSNRQQEPSGKVAGLNIVDDNGTLSFANL